MSTRSGPTGDGGSGALAYRLQDLSKCKIAAFDSLHDNNVPAFDCKISILRENDEE